jgi:excisionase family DNA binding protein
MLALREKDDTIIPTEEDTRVATESSRLLAKRQNAELRVRLDDGQEIPLPRGAVRLLSYLLIEMSRGNAVRVIPMHAALTTQEAAEYLNVSRPYLIGLLEKGEIAHHKVGTHRRVNFKNLVGYKRQMEQTSKRALDELAAEAQELGMGY